MNLTICVEEDDQVRHDINNKDVLHIYPNLPKSSNMNDHKKYARLRKKFLVECDMKAYEDLKKEHNIDFKPSYLKKNRMSKLTSFFSKLFSFCKRISKLFSCCKPNSPPSK